MTGHQFSDPNTDALFRQTMIAVNPDYFSWSLHDQERYRVAMPPDHEFKVKKLLLKGLFGIHIDSDDQLKQALRSLDNQRYLSLNSALLAFDGIGEDQFYLNEFLAEDTTLLDFETLHDFDYNDHCFQEKARKKEQRGYTPRPYRGSLYANWARLRIDGAFFYASLWMSASYLSAMTDDAATEKINDLLPHEYVLGEDHGKREGKGAIWDRRIDAQGKEGQLEELQHRYYAYLSERHAALSEQFDATAETRVYLVEDQWDTDPHMHFVFTDKTALKAVRFRHFMADCRAMLGDPQELKAILEQERQGVLSFLEQSHRDIMENFDPKIAKLRRKRKIVVADGALDGLL